MGAIKEADVLRDTLHLLSIYKRVREGFDFWRITTAGVPRETRFGLRFSKNPSAGMADILTSCILKENESPKIIWIECKRPHKTPEKLLSEMQIEFRRRVWACGHLYYIVTDPLKQLASIYGPT